MLPFTRDQFFAVFASYNDAIWPAQVVAYLLAASVVALLLRPGRLADRTISAILALLWLWTAVAYHWLAFAAVTPAAYIFGALFALQALYFVYAGVIRERLRFALRTDLSGILGMALIFYAAVLYPLAGMALGHAYPALPMFGVTPCPLTLFTFGLLLLTAKPVPAAALVIPFAWSLIGRSAAVLLDVEPDWVLLVSGLIAVPLIHFRDRRGARHA